MIDDHLYRQGRDRFLRETWRDGRTVVVVAAASVMFMLQAASIVIAIRAGIH
jgi:hypothetical protein